MICKLMAFIWDCLQRGKFQHPVVSFNTKQRKKSVTLDNKIEDKLCEISWMMSKQSFI